MKKVYIFFNLALYTCLVHENTPPAFTGRAFRLSQSVIFAIFRNHFTDKTCPAMQKSGFHVFRTPHLRVQAWRTVHADAALLKEVLAIFTLSG